MFAQELRFPSYQYIDIWIMSFNNGRRGRGVFVGARGRGNFWNARPKNPLAQLEESPFPPLGNLIETIDAKAFEDIDDDDGTQFGMKDVEPVASYNWVDQKAPKIIVPGMSSQFRSMEGAKCLIPICDRLSASLETTSRPSKASRR